MENIILTNNKDLRLVGVKVGVLSTLRFELPLVSASATHVEVIVTSGNVHSAYTATFIDATKRWQCDIAASQFPAVGKQSYEVAYVLDGKQFWDGKGWIEIEDATTSGIEPQPRPEPYRYAVVSVNGYGADAQGAVRIPKTFIATDSPTTTEGFMEGDIYFNRSTGATWTLCDVQGTLTWVFNYKNYYTKADVNGLLAGKATKADATLNISAGSWTCSPSTIEVETETGSATRAVTIVPQYSGTVLTGWVPATDGIPNGTLKGNAFSSDLVWEANDDWVGNVNLTATREVLNGMVLGSQTDKPLASEAEAVALRTGKQDALSDAQLANIAAVPNKADVSAIPYALVTKTITNGAVSLDDRASNAVTISTTLSPNTLTINFPTATSGKLRDFAMRLNIAAGVTAPEIAWPHGVTLENNGGEVPEIADGGTGGSSTILYFSETENNGTTAKFLVKGEALTAITQA